MTVKQFTEFQTLLMGKGLSEQEAFHIIAITIKQIDLETKSFTYTSEYGRYIKEMRSDLYGIITGFISRMGLEIVNHDMLIQQ